MSTSVSRWDRLRPLLVIVDDLQHGVRDLEEARGTAGESVDQKTLILAEESFEVLKTLRARSGAATDFYWNRGGLGDELLDVLFVTSAIANRLGVSLRDTAESLMRRGLDEVEWLSTGRGEEALGAGLAIADRVLCVLRSCAQLRASQDGGGAEPTRTREDASASLARLTLAVLTLSTDEQIDLSRLTRRTLAYDQLRLWTHGDDSG